MRQPSRDRERAVDHRSRRVTPVDAGRVRAAGTPRQASLLTSVSWAAREHLRLEDWISCGRRLGAMGRGVGWWLGDWLNFGNAVYGEKYARAARITGYDVQSLMNMAYVAARFDAGRRRERLSWSHHAELAALAAEEQDHWLERAERDRLSVRCLRMELRRGRAPEPPARDVTPSARADGATGVAAASRTCPNCGCSLRDQDGVRST